MTVVSALLLVTACATAAGDATVPTTSPTMAPTTTTETLEGATTGAPASTTTATVTSVASVTSVTSVTSTTSPCTTLAVNRIKPAYFFSASGGDDNHPGPLLVTAGRNVLDLEEAVWGVLDGLTPSEQDEGLTTAIPAGARTYFVRVTDHVAAVDLTARFTEAASAPALRARLAQLVFTVTGYDPTIIGVNVYVEGNPLQALPDGTPLNERLTRADFEDFLPAVLIEWPTWEAWSAPPVAIRGIAHGDFHIEILNTSGQVIASRAVSISGGTGWEAFEIVFDASELPSPDPAKDLSIRVYQIGPDGSPSSERVQPLSLRTRP